jgi:deoxyribodipyrimidine photo-lyase
MTVPDHMRVYSPLALKTTLPHKSDISLDPTLPLVIYTEYSIRPDWMNSIGANRVLVLSPSHFHKFPVSEKVIQFILSLARDNIE